MNKYNIDDFGAKKGNLSTNAIQSAIDKCFEEGGGIVEISNGTYISGTIFMKSNVHLKIEAGAKIFMSGNIEDFPNFDCEWNVKAAPRNTARCLIYVGNCENVSISGLGQIDCNAKAYCEVDPNPSYSDTDPFLCERMKRKLSDENTPARMIFVMKSKNVTLSDFTMTEMAGGWGIWVNGSKYVNINNLKLYCNPNYPNSDGIHINSSKDVFVIGCAIHSGDDAVIIRSNTNTLEEDIPCENIVVKGCTLSSHCQAIRVGWIGDGAIRNCVFSDLVITDSRDAITIYLPPVSVLSDLGKNTTRIERLSFNNIIIDKTHRYPVMIGIGNSELVKCDYVRNIQFNNVNSKTNYFPYLMGRIDKYLEDISFNNCRFEINEKADAGFNPRYVKNLKFDANFNID
ncbi:MAG: hypothetical protein J6Q58_02745 [Clostridia bacterium]|nr:hypothetical protein [Clostridia bacterium]